MERAFAKRSRHTSLSASVKVNWGSSLETASTRRYAALWFRVQAVHEGLLALNCGLKDRLKALRFFSNLSLLRLRLLHAICRTFEMLLP